ncbi:HAD family hydrolase [Luteolibacter algae]|uniref:phosphoglycolate phosphatase n=1 Tax=Luteolibacter algae TaxID=454151 RepID=A0ABW5D4H1_9BACT
MSRAYIFDLDGTLVNSLAGIAGSLNRALARYDLPLHGESAVRGFIGDGARMLAQRALPPGVSDGLLEKIVTAFAEDYGRTWADGTVAYPGIPELLDQLSKGASRLAVLSNKPHGFTTEIVEKIFPENTFTVVLGNREGLPHKPDPQGALEVCHALGVYPEDATLIGDSTMDLETAGNAGMKCIAVTWGYHDRERLLGAEHVVDSVEELAGLL